MSIEEYSSIQKEEYEEKGTFVQDIQIDENLYKRISRMNENY